MVTVLLAVKERARRENRTAGEVLSDLARQALTQQQRADPRTGPESFYGSNPSNIGGPPCPTPSSTGCVTRKPCDACPAGRQCPYESFPFTSRWRANTLKCQVAGSRLKSPQDGEANDAGCHRGLK